MNVPFTKPVKDVDIYQQPDIRRISFYPSGYQPTDRSLIGSAAVSPSCVSWTSEQHIRSLIPFRLFIILKLPYNMLSRLALPFSRASLCKLPQGFPQVTFKASVSDVSMPTRNAPPADTSERDLVNFPRPAIATYGGKVRLGFIPDEWFQFFYKKTGVTGPYIFGTGLITFLCSKEIYILEHEFYAGYPLVILAIIAVKKFGPGYTVFIDKEQDKHMAEYNDYKSNAIKTYTESIELEKKSQWSSDAQMVINNAKRENVHLQLEAEYRKRMMKTYTEVKKLLDYQVQTINTVRQVQHKHMVNWIVDSVMKSITPQQEEDALKKCIADLKSISASY